LIVTQSGIHDSDLKKNNTARKVNFPRHIPKPRQTPGKLTGPIGKPGNGLAASIAKQTKKVKESAERKKEVVCIDESDQSVDEGEAGIDRVPFVSDDEACYVIGSATKGQFATK